MTLFDKVPPGEAGGMLEKVEELPELRGVVVAGVFGEPNADEGVTGGELSLQDCGPIAIRLFVSVALL